MTLAHILGAYVALSLGVLWLSLAVTFAFGRLDHGATLCIVFSVGMALVWPIFFGLVGVALVLVACWGVLYVPVAIIAALRGKPLVSVTKETK